MHNTFMRLTRTFLALVVTVLALGRPAVAQTALTTTTTSAAIAAADTTMVIASTTNWLASTSAAQYFALVDRELVTVRSVNTTSKVIGISRGQVSTRAVAHVSGATVYFVPAAATQNYLPSGQCIRTNLLYVPVIVGGTPGGPIGSDTGTLWDCLGVTTGGQWVQTAPSLGVNVTGSTVASATSITPTGTYFVVSGTVNPVNTIVVPAGWQPGSCLALEPSGAFVTGTGGNISIVSTAVVGKMMFMCWNGTKWNPSY